MSGERVAGPSPAVVPLTDRLAAFAAGLEVGRVPPEALEVARDGILDLVGVALAGAPEPASRIVARLVREEGASPLATVLGAGFRTSAANAALANGTSGHALDYDDVNLAMRGHPSVVSAPAALAVAEACGAPGTEALAGYVAGVEVTISLAFGVGRTHYPAGWHSTATLGAIGAAAAAARVRRLDRERTRAALGIAASMASGLRRNFGSMTKPLHAGHAARCGVQAAALAAGGFTADAAALEGPLGFLAVVSRDSDPGAAVARLGRAWGLVSPGLSVKRHACCYGTHHAADALLDLRAEHRLGPDGVEAIDVLVAPAGMAALIHDRPRIGLEAKFSMPYILASALVDGELTLHTFTDEAVRRPEVLDLLPKVRCREADGAPVAGDDPRFAEVTVALRDGRRLHRRVDHPRGSPEAPLGRADLDRKFRDCAAAALSPSAVERVLQMLHEIDTLPDLHDLMRVLAGPGGTTSGF